MLWPHRQEGGHAKNRGAFILILMATLNSSLVNPKPGVLAGALMNAAAPIPEHDIILILSTGRDELMRFFWAACNNCRDRSCCSWKGCKAIKVSVDHLEGFNVASKSWRFPTKLFQCCSSSEVHGSAGFKTWFIKSPWNIVEKSCRDESSDRACLELPMYAAAAIWEALRRPNPDRVSGSRSCWIWELSSIGHEIICLNASSIMWSKSLMKLLKEEVLSELGIVLRRWAILALADSSNS